MSVSGVWGDVEVVVLIVFVEVQLVTIFLLTQDGNTEKISEGHQAPGTSCRDAREAGR